jgi:ribosomal protein S18 acetylase RimI-like enzyme
MDEIVTCADCGLRYMRALPEDEREHRRYHDEAINGPKTKLKDGCHIINMNAPKSASELAARAAILAKRDTRYDYPAYRADDNEESPVAFIMVIKGHVVGLVISRERRCWQRAPIESLRDKDSGTPVRSTVRRSIEMIWVLRECRGKGIARGLVAEASKHFALPIEEFAHTTPLTDDAQEFWRKIGLRELYVVPG